MSKQSLNRQSLIHAVRIAATEAKRSSGNPVYAQALDLVATALEAAIVSARSDGEYLLVKLPERVAASRL